MAAIVRVDNRPDQSIVCYYVNLMCLCECVRMSDRFQWAMNSTERKNSQLKIIAGCAIKVK